MAGLAVADVVRRMEDDGIGDIRKILHLLDDRPPSIGALVKDDGIEPKFLDESRDGLLR